MFERHSPPSRCVALRAAALGRAVCGLLLASALAGCGGCGTDPAERGRSQEKEPEVSRPEAPKPEPKARPEPAPVDPAFADTAAAVKARERLVARWGRTIESERVKDAMRAVHRHAFVPESRRYRAYEDNALPIGEDQTISQPWVVARMTELLQLGPKAKVLEVGTGSGYQAAVLAEMGAEVWSIEIIPVLSKRAARVLTGLGYDERVHLKVGDGYAGWPEVAPFDAVIITAAADHVPKPLLDQLKVGGRLVMPLGDPGYVQYLTRFTRTEDGIKKERFSGVRFVPMTGKADD
jgi:protein-L-isoaspartate(D-aspartate) O-methyltransferase